MSTIEDVHARQNLDRRDELTGEVPAR